MRQVTYDRLWSVFGDELLNCLGETVDYTSCSGCTFPYRENACLQWEEGHRSGCVEKSMEVDRLLLVLGKE